MPTSPARIAANQINAQKSTGPNTDEGKARSRLNAFRHGMAGQGDLVGPGDDQALIDQRTRAFVRELAAPGAVGEVLARRAAILSVRVEKSADREFKAVALAIQAGLDQFDDERAARLESWVVEAEESAIPDHALFELESCPEGLRYLREAWPVLRTLVTRDDQAAKDRAAHWLGLDRTDPGMPASLLPGIDAEIARLAALVDSPTLLETARQVRTQRDNAGQIASFDPSPEATLARRYEAAAERGMYRALREIRELRREANPAGLFTLPTELLHLTSNADRNHPPRPASRRPTPTNPSIGFVPRRRSEP